LMVVALPGALGQHLALDLKPLHRQHAH
jgi:hypothetical protein